MVPNFNFKTHLLQKLSLVFDEAQLHGFAKKIKNALSSGYPVPLATSNFVYPKMILHNRSHINYRLPGFICNLLKSCMQYLHWFITQFLLSHLILNENNGLKKGLKFRQSLHAHEYLIVKKKSIIIGSRGKHNYIFQQIQLGRLSLRITYCCQPYFWQMGWQHGFK